MIQQETAHFPVRRNSTRKAVSPRSTRSPVVKQNRVSRCQNRATTTCFTIIFMSRRDALHSGTAACRWSRGDATPSPQSRGKSNSEIPPRSGRRVVWCQSKNDDNAVKSDAVLHRHFRYRPLWTHTHPARKYSDIYAGAAPPRARRTARRTTTTIYIQIYKKNKYRSTFARRCISHRLDLLPFFISACGEMSMSGQQSQSHRPAHESVIATDRG